MIMALGTLGLTKHNPGEFQSMNGISPEAISLGCMFFSPDLEHLGVTALVQTKSSNSVTQRP
jgi:hypothetical protein